jgi:hypothetical protein
VAVNVTWFPSTIDPFAGVTVTTAAGGGGGGGGCEAPPAPQPNDHAHSARIAKTRVAAVPDDLALLCERERMPSQMQAKGQRRRPNRRMKIRKLASKARGEKPHKISRLPILQNGVAQAGTLKERFSLFYFDQTSF